MIKGNKSGVIYARGGLASVNLLFWVGDGRHTGDIAPRQNSGHLFSVLQLRASLVNILINVYQFILTKAGDELHNFFFYTNGQCF